MVIHDPQLGRARANPVTLPRVAMDAVAATGLPVTPMLETYARWHGLQLERHPDALTLRFPGGSFFDIGLTPEGYAESFKGTLQVADVPPGAIEVETTRPD